MIVCPGVTIGAHTVVGAGSVVTKDLPERVVAVGSPARVVREAGLNPNQQTPCCTSEPAYAVTAARTSPGRAFGASRTFTVTG